MKQTVLPTTFGIIALLAMASQASAQGQVDPPPGAMPQYAQTTGSYYGGAAPQQYYQQAPQQAYPQGGYPQQQAAPQGYAMSAYEQQEQAIQQSKAMNQADTTPINQMPGADAQSDPSQQQPQQFNGHASKTQKLKSATRFIGKLAGRTAAVGLPITGLVLLTRAASSGGMGMGMPMGGMGMGGMGMGGMGMGMPMGGMGMGGMGMGMPMGGMPMMGGGMPMMGMPGMMNGFR